MRSLRTQVQQDRLNIVDILNKFKSIEVSAAQLFELLPRLQVRYYSIASSDKTHPTTVAIVAVVDKETMPCGKVLLLLLLLLLLALTNAARHRLSPQPPL
jgi:sulfite reductase alpha subunit-like flavoprotein